MTSALESTATSFAPLRALPSRNRSAAPPYGKAIQGAYPKIHTIRLVEAATHMAVETLIKPAKSNEYPAAPALLKK
ncbi:MAG: hypothetical protein NTU53_00665 [Planctomycetota bacterium]|nr:hypothetical protein [Planctomycetota bacterium]